MKRKLKAAVIVCALACALMTACGVPGAPQPPSLELPKPADDLRAGRKGDKVTLAWTTPHETTDRTAVRHTGVTRICRELGTVPMAECGNPVGQVAAAQLPASAEAEYVDTLPKDLQVQNPFGYVTYAVETENTKGRSAGLSNQIQIPTAPTMPPPENVKAKLTPDAVVIHWPAAGPRQFAVEPGKPLLAYSFRVYRHADGVATDVVVGELSEQQTWAPNEPAVADHTFEWEKTYQYYVTPVTTVVKGDKPAMSIEGDDSAPVQVVTHDVFPPATPSGVEAVYANNGIDLTWSPNVETDLAGYNVYRHEEGAEAVKINTDLVKAPSFRDRNVQPGHKYFYSVSAVDLRGNESGRSAEASESVPQ